MLETTIDEISSAFSAAKNANAALKAFLKKEARAGDSVERFAKDFRSAIASGKPAIVRAFIERNFPQNEIYFLISSRYAHSEFVTSLVEKIFEEHAEVFNTTYEKIEGGIKIKDKAKFSAIVKAVLGMVDEELKSAPLPVTNFLRKTVLMCVFEDEVLKEVLLLKGVKTATRFPDSLAKSAS